MSVEPEIILLIGGAVVTLGVAIFVIVLITFARREHDAEVRREAEERREAPVRREAEERREAPEHGEGDAPREAEARRHAADRGGPRR